MKLRSVLPMRIAKYGYIIVSVVLCAAGLAMLLLPPPSPKTVGIFFGTVLLIFGLIKLIGYFSKDLYRLAFQFDLQFGILMIILGIVALARPGNAVSFVCTSLGVVIIADSLFKSRIALEARSFGIGEWWLTLGLAVLTGIAGVVLAVSPSDAIATLIKLIGAAIIAEGALNLGVSISLVKIIKNQKPDVIEADYYEIS